MTALIATLSQLSPRRAPLSRAAVRRMAGPGLLVAVGYIDPGNWATDIAAGSAYGYTLLGAVLLASLLGLLFQNVAAQLGVATGKDLAALTREHLPRPLARTAWLAAEIGIVATALAELVGGAIALRLLFGLPLAAGLTVAALGTLALMALSRRSHHLHEHAVGVLLLVVSLAFFYLLVRAQPASADVLRGALGDRQVLAHDGMLAVALGILGATVMPHNLFLHSGLVAERSAALPTHERPIALQVAKADTRLSLLLATVVNAAILVVAAAALGRLGRPLDDLDDAHQALVAALGVGAGVVFAVALYAAGQSSAVTGVMAGRILSRGFAGRESRVWLRGIATRLAAICAAFALLALWPQASPDRLLVLSQCVLGMTLPFALVPMLLLAFRRRLLGGMAFGPVTLAMAAAGTALVLGLDGYLLATAL